MKGTIDKEYPRALLGYAFEFGEQSASERILEEVFINAKVAVTVEKALKEPKDSQDIDDNDRRALVNRIELGPEKRFIITHGTDSLAETAKFVDLPAKKCGATVVLMGSRLPEAFKGSDASFNFGFSLCAVQHLSEGAHVAMNGVAIAAQQVARDPKSGMWIDEDN